MLFSPVRGAAKVSWKKEIWPFQWRIAVSWLSGYFIFQLFVPVLFSTRGPVEAGRMGFGLAIANALIGVPVAWLNTKTPRFGELIARRDYARLDHMFMTTLSVTVIVIVFGGGALSVLDYAIYSYHLHLADRLLEPVPFTMLMLATIVNFVTIAEAAYLRAHKEEPFLYVSLLSGVTIGTITVSTAGRYGSIGIMAGYLCVSIVIGLGWGSFIFFSRRRDYQSRASASVTTDEVAADVPSLGLRKEADI